VYVESFTRAKDPGRPDLNEDRAVVYADRTFAVIDGVTDKSGQRYDGLTGGVLAGMALEARLRELTDDGTLVEAPAEVVVARLNAAIAYAYERNGIARHAAEDPTARFAAALVVAHFGAAGLRLIGVGDCGARLDGRVVVAGRNVLDGALGVLRREAFAALAELEPEATLERRLEVARAYTVHGLGGPPPGTDVAPRVHAAIAARARAAMEPAMAAWPADVADAVAAGGLRAVSALRRTDASGTSRLGRAGLDVGVLDGFPLSPTLISDQRRGHGEFATLELYSDGYFGYPDDHGRVAHWEAHHRHVERTDPHRIGAFASTKGSHGDRSADDRTVLIVRKEPPGA